jgi:hypothetical protein
MAANRIAVISMCNTIIGSIQMTSLKHVLSVEHCLDVCGWCGVTGARITPGLCIDRAQRQRSKSDSDRALRLLRVHV